MQKTATFLDAPGTKADLCSFQTAKGRAFAAFLLNAADEAYARVLEFRRVDGPCAADLIAFEVKVERPQKVVYPIRREERLAVLFFDKDHTYPDVLALRADFPEVPHTNLRDSELPRGLCLYDQPYENVKLDWTPARFLNRIRHWLQTTATGTLHGEDQPLEPLLLAPRERLILPGDCSLRELQKESGLFQVFRCLGPDDEITLIAQPHNPDQKQNADSVAAIFTCAEQTHGVIRFQPRNLAQLHDFCAKAGLNLARELVAKARAWILNKPTKEILACKLIIILLLPKKRSDGTRIETIEQWAFMTMKTVEEVGVALDVFGRGGGASAYIIGTPQPAKTRLADIPVATLQVLHGLSAGRAAAMNGTEEMTDPVFAIGQGALGSQIFNNLVRSGFGRWTLVDPDILLPHNGARHFLGSWAVGQNKAEAMAHVANSILDKRKDGEPVATAIVADFLKPGKNASLVEAQYKAAGLVLDLSASIAVSRQCASSNAKARHISAFLSPSGNSLILTAEDKGRAFRLDWLEMLHYRSVLHEDSLKSSLRPPDARFRYGNSCRDVSFELAQDDAAVWAGTASKAIRGIFKQDEARVRIYLSGTIGSVTVFEPRVVPLVEAEFVEWIVRFDEVVLDKLADLRRSKLPNETGGVLLGHFDTHRSICSIIDVVESPPDSEEWPTSYIRGCEGLREKVREAEIATLDQISYVGEWHSHPRGVAVRPSDTDLKAYAWLSSRMLAESLPGIMLIIGDDRRFCLVAAPSAPLESSRKRRKPKTK